MHSEKRNMSPIRRFLGRDATGFTSRKMGCIWTYVAEQIMGIKQCVVFQNEGTAWAKPGRKKWLGESGRSERCT